MEKGKDNLVIREATGRDIDKITVLWDRFVRTGDVAYKENAFEMRRKFHIACLHSDRILILVAVIKRRVVGFLKLHVEEDPYEWQRDHDRFGWIDTLVVHPEFQRRKIGKRLMREGYRWLENKGVLFVYVKIPQGTEDVYRAFGFHPFRLIFQKKLDIPRSKEREKVD